MKKSNVVVLCSLLCAAVLISASVIGINALFSEETKASDPEVTASTSPSEKTALSAYLPEGEIYEYPITPRKTPEQWKQLVSHGQMLKVCQIPEDILDTMTTRQLLLTCIDYPLAADALVYTNDLRTDPFRPVIRMHNGLTELFKRPDFSSELAALYKYYTESVSEDPEKFDALLNESDPELLRQNRLSRLSCLCYMTRSAMREDMLNASDIVQIKDCSAELSSKFDKKTSEYDYFSGVYKVFSGEIPVSTVIG